jgi:hypothetical protein
VDDTDDDDVVGVRVDRGRLLLESKQDEAVLLDSCVVGLLVVVLSDTPYGRSSEL